MLIEAKYLWDNRRIVSMSLTILIQFKKYEYVYLQKFRVTIILYITSKHIINIKFERIPVNIECDFEPVVYHKLMSKMLEHE